MAASQRAALPDQLPASAPMPDRYCFTLNFGHNTGGSLHSHYVPFSDVSMRSKLRGQKAWNSLDQLISLCDELRRHFEPERLGGLEVDHQLELRGLLDGQVGGLGALQDLVHIGGSAPKHISKVRSIGHKAPGIDKLPPKVHGRQPVLCRQVHEASSLIEEHAAWQHSQSTHARAGHVREGPVEILRPSCFNELKPYPQRPCRDFCSR